MDRAGAQAPEQQPGTPEQSNKAAGRGRQSTDAALADIDQALAESLSMVRVGEAKQTELQEEEEEDDMPAAATIEEEEEEEEEDDMPTATCVLLMGFAVSSHLVTTAPGVESILDRIAANA